jgi:hypothetical protein
MHLRVTRSSGNRLKDILKDIMKDIIKDIMKDSHSYRKRSVPTPDNSPLQIDRLTDCTDIQKCV